MSRRSKLTAAARERIHRWAQQLSQMPTVKGLAAEVGCSERVIQRALREAYLRARQYAGCDRTDITADYDVSRETNGGRVGPQDGNRSTDDTEPRNCDSDLR